MKVKYLLVFFCIFFSNVVLSDEPDYLNYVHDYSDEDDGVVDNLYIYKARKEEYKSLDSITYYISDTDFSENGVSGDFLKFAEMIGLKNGAVYLSLTKSVSGKNQSSNFEYLDLSSCSMRYFQNNSIVFESIETKQCVRLPVSDTNYLSPMLVVIKRNLDDIENIDKKADIIKFYDALKADLKRLDIPEENIGLVEAVLNIVRQKYLSIVQSEDQV